VKRRTLVLTVVAGLLVFLGVLVLYLPAAWFASALPAQVKCAELGGSVWQGECLGLTFQNAKLGDVTWNLAPSDALSGRLVGDVALTGDTQRLTAELDLGRDGAGELRNVNGQVQMDPALLPQFPRNQRGTVIATFKRIDLASGGSPRLLDGTLQLRDFRQVGSRPLELGSYQLTFDGTAQPGRAITGQLRDLGGPFAVNGTVSLPAPRSYLVQGFITGRSAEAERLVREITLGAPPDGSGRSAFSFEGSY
jgi:hypothetical protein